MADDTFTADNTTETLTAVAHGLETGDGPLRLTTSGGLPTGLALATDYWIIRTGADTFQLASSLANAYASTEVTFTTDGTGTHTFSDTATTQRGIDVEFTYTATQAETNYDTAAIIVSVVDGTHEAYTSVTIDPEAASVWAQTMEGAHTYGDGMRVLVRGEAAPFAIVGASTRFATSQTTTRSSVVFPAMCMSVLPGRRVDPMRAWMMAVGFHSPTFARFALAA